jgi:hypothetical protein
MTNIPLGTYDHISNNLHVYERHFEMVDKILDTNDLGTLAYTSWNNPHYNRVLDLDTMDRMLSTFFKKEERIRNNIPFDTRDFIGAGTLLDDLMFVTWAGCAAKLNRNAEADYCQGRILDFELARALDYWRSRRQKS